MNKRSCVHVVRAAAILLLAFCLTVPARAQTERPFSFDIGGGFTPAVGALSTRLDNGWNITGGVAYNFHSPFSIGARVMYNGFGVNRNTLTLAGAPDGDAHVFSVTAEPRLRIPIGDKVNPYIVGGVGYYRRTVNFTQPALQSVLVLDPFFGFVTPGVVGTNQVLASITRDGIGGNLGAGFSFGLGREGIRLYTEARYHYATGGVPTRMVPVTIGIRF